MPQNTVYMTVKALLERMAPVLIDGMAVSALLGLADATIKSSLNDDDDMESVVDADNPVSAGMKLLLVSHTRKVSCWLWHLKVNLPPANAVW